MRTTHVRLRRPFVGALAALGVTLLAACEGGRPLALEPEGTAPLAASFPTPAYSMGLVLQLGYTDLPPVQNATSPASSGSGMNQQGWVAGSTQGYFDGRFVQTIRATLWTPAGAQELGVLGQGHSAQNSWATDVNGAGVVAGYTTGVTASGGCCTAMTADATGAQHAVVWKGVGQPPVDLGTFGGTSAAAYDINDAGQVVGSLGGGFNPGAFLWSEGSGVQLLGHLGGGWAEARGINEAGHVAVTATVPDETFGIIPTRAYLWVEGTWIDLGDGLGWSGATALNDQGQVAGYALSAGTGANGAARWDVTLARPSTYEFTGFFAPVDNLPAVNRARAGSSIPVKFSLGGDRGLDVLAAGYPSSQPIACEAAATLVLV